MAQSVPPMSYRPCMKQCVPALARDAGKHSRLGFAACFCCKLPACHAHRFSALLPLQSPGSAVSSPSSTARAHAPGWVRKLHGEAQRQTSAIQHSWPLQEKQHLPTVSSFPAYMSGLSMSFCTPKGKVLQLVSQHIFLQPPSLPLQLHQPAQLSQGMHPTTPADAASAI